MSAQELLASLAAGGPGPAAMTWAVHQGMRGAQRTTVLADGRVLRDDEVLGAVPRTRVAELARAMTAALSAEAPGPTDPGHLLTVELTGHGVSEQRQLAMNATDVPEVAALRALFTAVADEAGQSVPGPVPATPSVPGPAPAAHPVPGPAPITIQPAAFYWVTMILGGLMTCGVVAVVMWAVMRKLPAAMDANGVTTRGGRVIPWSELSLRRRVNAERPDEVVGYDLMHPDGTEIRLAVGAFTDGQAVVRYALERMGA